MKIFIAEFTKTKYIFPKQIQWLKPLNRFQSAKVQPEKMWLKELVDLLEGVKIVKNSRNVDAILVKLNALMDLVVDVVYLHFLYVVAMENVVIHTVHKGISKLV